MSIAFWQKLNLAAFGANTLVTYALGSTDKIGKLIGAKSNKQMSDKYPTLVTPKGYAFAIWAPIFLLEGGFSVWQLYQSDSNLLAASPYWCTGCMLQAAWTIAFAFDNVTFSTVLLGGIAAAVGSAYSCIQRIDTSGSTVDYVLSAFPFALHAGWLVAATLVNINIATVAAKASPQLQLRLAWASEIVAAVLGTTLSVYFYEPTFMMVGAWALRAISAFEAPSSFVEQFDPVDRDALRAFAKITSHVLALLGTAMVVHKLLM
jgi:hypothetical protein